MDTRTVFWGAPKVTQWPSVPFYILQGLFWIGGVSGAVATKRSIERSFGSNRELTRTAEITQAEPYGFGFWRIKYIFPYGPKVYVGNCVSPGAILPDMFGEFIWPFHPKHKELTTVGSEIDVHFSRVGPVVGSACVDQGLAVPYVVAGTLWSVFLMRASWVVYHRTRVMLIHHSLHTTQPGITMLKRQEIHESLGKEGPGPLDKLLSAGYTEDQKYFWGGRSAFDQEMRRRHESVTREWNEVRAYRNLQEMRQDVEREKQQEQDVRDKIQLLELERAEINKTHLPRSGAEGQTGGPQKP
eukprot:TRINITY_DN28244_c0_g1_i1.p1 TRINITY_DN28244_c0_g1~~TRINITY_DN28244_c0_g1_i1.p1  ORF type:complete len:299 (+),score=66.17 TRINITY_DN28244_c0_g1_i1:190-1086(+)